jgi:Mn2+/Fe2+ NRAMP family transporter
MLAVPLLTCCGLALISEITVIGETIQSCWDISPIITNTVFTLLLCVLVLTGSYTIAERVGLTMGFLQVFFFGTMFMNNPEGSQIWQDLWAFPLNDLNFVKLVTANIGAVIMPWMLAYQQSALCEKALTHHDPDTLLIERIDTGVGSFLTQGVMAAMLITVAASPKFDKEDIVSVDQLLEIFASTMGSEIAAKIALTFAVCGACVVAAIVVTLCGAWTLEQAMGMDRNKPAMEQSTNDLGAIARIRRDVSERKTYYAAYGGTCVFTWFLTIAAPRFTESLTGVWTQFINGLLMPPVIFALWYMAAYRLQPQYRLGPCLKWSLLVVFGMCAAFCLVSIPFAIGDALNS